MDLTDDEVLLKDISKHQNVLIDVPYTDPRRLDKLVSTLCSVYYFHKTDYTFSSLYWLT